MNLALTGLAIVTIAALGGWHFVRRRSPEQPKAVKAVLFGLYFWGLVFLELIVAAVAYHFLH